MNVLPNYLNNVKNFACKNYEKCAVKFSVQACVDIFYNNKQKLTKEPTRKYQIKDFSIEVNKKSIPLFSVILLIRTFNKVIHSYSKMFVTYYIVMYYFIFLMHFQFVCTLFPLIWSEKDLSQRKYF